MLTFTYLRAIWHFFINELICSLGLSSEIQKLLPLFERQGN